MTLDTFSSPTAGGSSVRRQRITSDDLSSPDPDYPWTTHPTALPPPPPPLAAAGLSATAAAAASASSSSHPPITPQRYSAPSASQGPPGGGAQHFAAHRDGQTFSPSGYMHAPPPAATTNASPSFDRKASSSAAGGSMYQATAAASSSTRPSGSGLCSWDAEQPAAARDAGPISRRMVAGVDGSRPSRKMVHSQWAIDASADGGRKVLRRSRTAEWRPAAKETDSTPVAARDTPSQEAAMDDASAGAGDNLAGEDQPMSGDA